ncbi:MAG: hypothetical protein M3280_09535 [Actinomycetota bacterium]|nr:hypothetical protein [Actinomycetota bacterium]
MGFDAAQYEAMYPGAGIHKLSGSQYADVSPEVSSLSQAGELEHTQDLDWAYSLSYGHIILMINLAAMLGTPAEADTEAEALRLVRESLRNVLDPEVRWPASMTMSPGSWQPHWQQIFAQLSAATRERDTNAWHSFPWTEVTDPADKASNNVPASAKLERYQPGGQIGTHDPYSLVKSKYDSLPKY